MICNKPITVLALPGCSQAPNQPISCFCIFVSCFHALLLLLHMEGTCLAFLHCQSFLKRLYCPSQTCNHRSDPTTSQLSYPQTTSNSVHSLVPQFFPQISPLRFHVLQCTTVSGTVFFCPKYLRSSEQPMATILMQSVRVTMEADQEDVILG